MSTALLAPRRTPRRYLPLAPLVVLVAAALVANAGGRVAGDAHAAATSIIVTAPVSATASTATNGCAANTMTISFTMNTLSPGTCVITFGSTNASGITLSADDSTQADQFMTQGTNNFADATTACSAMAAADQVGYKVDVGGTATVNLCAANAAATNAQFSAIPNDVPSVVGPDTVCTTNALGTQTCPIVVGMFETGTNAPAATYGGTITVTSS